MNKHFEVFWTERSLRNAKSISKYILNKFSKKEVAAFEQLLRNFEKTVSHFPHLYSESIEQKGLRRAVLHKNLTVFYVFKNNKITVIAMQENRQEKAEE